MTAWERGPLHVTDDLDLSTPHNEEAFCAGRRPDHRSRLVAGCATGAAAVDTVRLMTPIQLIRKPGSWPRQIVDTEVNRRFAPK